jgi:hypothetical protein
MGFPLPAISAARHFWGRSLSLEENSMRSPRIFVPVLLAVFLLCTTAGQAADKWGLKPGAPDLKSAGPLAFGPDSILLVADPKAAAVFAIATGDKPGDPAKVKLELAGLNEKAAALLDAAVADLKFNDLAINPASGNAFLSVTKTRNGETTAALLRLDAAGKLSEVLLRDIPFAKVALPNPPEDKVTGEGFRRRNLRDDSITDLAFAEGKVLVSGVTANPSPSNVRELPFPFTTADSGTSIEIYHGAHGRLEDNATVRTFVPFMIDGEPTLLAGFTCTPLVKFPLASLEPGVKVRGTTVAELGNMNQPLDMIVYKKEGKSFILMANSKRGVMKISTQDINRKEGITQPVTGGGTAGQTYEKIASLEGVVQLDKLNDEFAVVLVQSEPGKLDLRTVALP